MNGDSDDSSHDDNGGAGLVRARKKIRLDSYAKSRVIAERLTRLVMGKITLSQPLASLGYKKLDSLLVGQRRDCLKTRRPGIPSDVITLCTLTTVELRKMAEAKKVFSIIIYNYMSHPSLSSSVHNRFLSVFAQIPLAKQSGRKTDIVALLLQPKNVPHPSRVSEEEANAAADLLMNPAPINIDKEANSSSSGKNKRSNSSANNKSSSVGGSPAEDGVVVPRNPHEQNEQFEPARLVYWSKNLYVCL